jgi:hypothetical protein
VAEGRILFVGTNEVDYLMDVVLSGLVARLGHHRVYDWPFSGRVYLRRKGYPRTMLRRSKLSLLRRFQAKRDFAEFDLVVVAACKPSCVHAYRQIQDKIPVGVPVVFIDGGDRTELGGDLDRLGEPTLFADTEAKRPFDLVFKREKWLDHDFGRDCVAFPNAFHPDFMPPRKPKKYDVAFWGVESHETRVRAFELLRDKYDCATNGTIRGVTFHQHKRKGGFFLEELGRCKIALSLPGIGWDCQRYWEAPGVGAFMITPKAPLEIPDDFVSGQHVVHCKDDVSDLIELCDYYLEHEDEREAIAAAGQKHCLQYHSHLARADRLLASVGERCGVTIAP